MVFSVGTADVRYDNLKCRVDHHVLSSIGGFFITVMIAFDFG